MPGSADFGRSTYGIRKIIYQMTEITNKHFAIATFLHACGFFSESYNKLLLENSLS